MSILQLLKEHGDMTFEEIADIIGSGMDYIDLEMKLQRLAEQGKVFVYKNEDDVRVYSFTVKKGHPEYFAEPMGDEII